MGDGEAGPATVVWTDFFRLIIEIRCRKKRFLTRRIICITRQINPKAASRLPWLGSCEKPEPLLLTTAPTSIPPPFP